MSQTARLFLYIPNRRIVNHIQHFLPVNHITGSYQLTQFIPGFLTVILYEAGSIQPGTNRQVIHQRTGTGIGNLFVPERRTVRRRQAHHQYFNDTGIFRRGYPIDEQKHVFQLPEVIPVSRNDLRLPHGKVNYRTTCFYPAYNGNCIRNTPRPAFYKTVLLRKFIPGRQGRNNIRKHRTKLLCRCKKNDIRSQ